MGPTLYILTPMTRDAKQGRRRVVGGFDVPYTAVVLFLIALLPGLAVSLMLYPWLGTNALLGFAAVELGAFWLFRFRSRQGLQLRNFETIRDRKRSQDGVWKVCGHAFDPNTTSTVTLLQSSVPQRRTTPAPSATSTSDAVDLALGRA